MKITYYPGCTLKTKAKNLEDAALASLKQLGINVEEVPRWNCCGAVTCLSEDDLLHHIAPVRVLIRAMDAGSDQIVTLCSQCYNTLARSNALMKTEPDKRETLNRFMDEENDYAGEVEVVHFLELLRDEVGWTKLRQLVQKPLEGLKIAPFYGCAMLRPKEFTVGGADGRPTIMQDFLTALGAKPVDFAAAEECCGSYETLVHPTEGMQRASKVLLSAQHDRVDALALSCPMCDYNLEHLQNQIRIQQPEVGTIPVFYFSQLLALALNVEVEACRFELNAVSAKELLAQRNLLDAASA